MRTDREQVILDQLLKFLNNYFYRPDLTASLFLLILLFFIALSILWIILPFAVFGIKKKLDEIIKDRQKTVIHLGRLFAQNRKINTLLSETQTQLSCHTHQQNVLLFSMHFSGLDPILADFFRTLSLT